jgi:predicted alpha/beta hydrolase
MAFRELSIPARDGRLLAARRWPAGSDPLASVVIGPAMGVSQGFYAPLAAWLAERGVAALTFDLRGVGRSRVEPLAEERADLQTWATQDLAGALVAGASLAPGKPRWYLGHSLGGQVLPLVPGASSLSGVVTVAAGSGWWPYSAPPLRRRIRLFWGLVVPVATWWAGYFPGRRLKMVGDVPRRAMLQWRDWCQHPDYLFGHLPEAREAYATFAPPVLAVSFSDDELLGRAAIDDLCGRLPKDRLTRIHHEPLPGEQLGHFGAFQPGPGPRHWSRWFEPLLGGGAGER